MTVKQMQCLLTYLGYDPGVIDGVDGPNTQKALADFTADYGVGVDGLAGAVGGTVPRLKSSFDILVETTLPTTSEDKLNWWKDIRYFNRSEFRCKCGGKYCNGYPVEPSEKLVRVLDEFRKKCGSAVVIGSGIRCKKHNSAVGGASASQHLYGTAADLYCSSKSTAEMKAIAEKLLGDSGGIGTYSWGIHLDVRKNKSRWKG